MNTTINTTEEKEDRLAELLDIQDNDRLTEDQFNEMQDLIALEPEEA